MFHGEMFIAVENGHTNVSSVLVCISQCTNTLGEDMNPIILHQTLDK